MRALIWPEKYVCFGMGGLEEVISEHAGRHKWWWQFYYGMWLCALLDRNRRELQVNKLYGSPNLCISSCKVSCIFLAWATLFLLGRQWQWANQAMEAWGMACLLLSQKHVSFHVFMLKHPFLGFKPDTSSEHKGKHEHGVARPSYYMWNTCGVATNWKLTWIYYAWRMYMMYNNDITTKLKIRMFWKDVRFICLP